MNPIVENFVVIGSAVGWAVGWLLGWAVSIAIPLGLLLGLLIAIQAIYKKPNEHGPVAFWMVGLATFVILLQADRILAAVVTIVFMFAAGFAWTRWADSRRESSDDTD